MTARTSARADATRAVRQAAKDTQRRRQRNSWLLWGGAGVVILIVLSIMAWTARDTSSSATRVAPDFTLTDTSGKPVHLADFQGKNVILYFNEGVGCQACFYQMTDIDNHATDFAALNTVVLPIVMNPPDQVRADMAANNVRTPYLIDTDGAVSKAYGTLGKGMHAGLPGHSFVFIDTTGNQRWYGEYPSMYLSPADLLTQVRKHLV